MTLTIELGPAPEVAFGPSPLGELVSALHLLSAAAHHPAQHAWITSVTAALPADLADRIQSADVLWQVGRADFLVPSRVRATLAEDLDDLDGIDDEAFLHAAFIPACGADRRRRPAASDANNRTLTMDRARELANARGPRQAEFVDRLIADLPGVRAWLRRLFTDCDQAFFADAWRRVRVGLVTEARNAAELHRTKGLAAAVRSMSPALAVADGRLLIDKLRESTASATARGITFSPTAFGWPHVVVADEPGRRPVVQYPVEHAGATTPLDVLTRRLEALSNPARLRLCWQLARGAQTTGELAAAWQLSLPEVSRHLAVLHRAGLLSKNKRGRYTLHRMDLVAVSRLGTDLVDAMLR
ncbi:winged helix-turn-helix transcriptional regulator [Solihabitans fulvus]|uniref:Winged helix-turn-helix transcriptional regulator n=1 Tax=Solihabitans fulvus TaxID=1892852 RepID=A0A5B2WTG1_9PSEU|nr:DUF5937 family protein [Solihabitans fulvus]KAA2253826.1 winged helix-turn-helix transcriptional regulator [Solihabitans fulvus]